jgi:hypothetical protein
MCFPTPGVLQKQLHGWFVHEVQPHYQLFDGIPDLLNSLFFTFPMVTTLHLNAILFPTSLKLCDLCKFEMWWIIYDHPILHSRIFFSLLCGIIVSNSFFLSKNAFTSILTVGVIFKIETYSVLANVWLSAFYSLVVHIRCLLECLGKCRPKEVLVTKLLL